MGILSNLVTARDALKNSLGDSRYSYLFGGTTAGKSVNEKSPYKGEMNAIKCGYCRL